ncbi:hypothetical protein GUJ93_ZPchr0014g46689 [Zizania palustris]|uniref:Uncharacterized protein n=1 Tax=Zizania palustris TaxID=103762 RepID=A0A8J5W5S1_ZIZPA|nr:hypothetical protein GUJ93_ZPchr0014g46689 [Zizania palustris]
MDPLDRNPQGRNPYVLAIIRLAWGVVYLGMRELYERMLGGVGPLSHHTLRFFVSLGSDASEETIGESLLRRLDDAVLLLVSTVGPLMMIRCLVFLGFPTIRMWGARAWWKLRVWTLDGVTTLESWIGR